MEDVQTLKEAQHQNFIWTWKSNGKGSKASIWIPYLAGIERKPRSKNWILSYNGGKLEVDLDKVDFIMFFGASGDLPLEFLDDVSQQGIVLMIHRRNVIRPMVFFPANASDDVDVLTRQILVRNHDQKAAYVAKVLIRQRLEGFKSTIPISTTLLKTLAAAKTVKEVRAIEAKLSARYWEKWFERLGVDSTRRSEGPLQEALDAGSKFLHGILLRWTLFHKLSPSHGFLHEPTNYPSLIYDLMEPHRDLIERSVASAWLSLPEDRRDEKTVVAAGIAELKRLLDEVVYVPATRQYVRRKNLLHGTVLSLRAYLLDESVRLVLPVEGEKKGGRPPKVGYRLPGETTDKKR